MTSAKILILLLAFAVGTYAGNLTIGNRIPYDKLLQHNTIEVPAKVLQVVELKQTFEGNNHNLFTLVKVVDLDKKGNGAKVNVLSGGVEKNFITVNFESQRGGSINFSVEIYGI